MKAQPPVTDTPEPGKQTRLAGLRARLDTMVPFDWELLKHAGAEPIPHHLKRWWFCLGGTVGYLFVVQVVTGVMLTFYYIPTQEEAYASVAAITREIRFGWFIRSLHKWAANLMILAVFLHIVRVYFTGGYRNPRQLNWMIGCGLLGTTLTFGFTGYSLIYEQLSFWGATVACNLADAVPLIGPHVAYFLRGGADIGAHTLTRFYILHIVFLPILTMGLVGLHIFFVRLHGVTELNFEDEVVTPKERFFKFWPDHATTELLVGILLMYFLTIIALVFPAGLGEPADPTTTPPHIKPEWYFYFSFRLLKLTSLKLSVLMTMAFGMVIFFWPFIEEVLQKRFKLSDSFSVAMGVLGFLGFLVLTVWESLA